MKNYGSGIPDLKVVLPVKKSPPPLQNVLTFTHLNPRNDCLRKRSISHSITFFTARQNVLSAIPVNRTAYVRARWTDRFPLLSSSCHLTGKRSFILAENLGLTLMMRSLASASLIIHHPVLKSFRVEWAGKDSLGYSVQRELRWKKPTFIYDFFFIAFLAKYIEEH